MSPDEVRNLAVKAAQHIWSEAMLGGFELGEPGPLNDVSADLEPDRCVAVLLGSRGRRIRMVLPPDLEKPLLIEPYDAGGLLGHFDLLRFETVGEMVLVQN